MLVIVIPAAFAFARLEFRGKNLVFTLLLSLMMIPNELVVITNFATITNLRDCATPSPVLFCPLSCRCSIFIC